MGKLNDAAMFLNDNYSVLKVLYDNEQVINNRRFTAITQQEICETMGCSLMKVNAIILKLKETGYVTAYRNSRGRYQLTEKAYLLLKDIDRLKGKDDRSDKS